MDWESVRADLRAAEATSRTNRAMIAQSREVLKRAGDALERIRRDHLSIHKRHRVAGGGFRPKSPHGDHLTDLGGGWS